MRRGARRAAALGLALAVGCSSDSLETAGPALTEPPPILLVTLDTTRADRVGFESAAAETPNLDALAARGVRFAHAYTTAPETLPAHASMLTGLYPPGHGVHENGRPLAGGDGAGAGPPLLAERLRARGYRTAAFVSGAPLARRYGLARGFDHYDDDFGGGDHPAGGGDSDRGGTGAAERPAAETAARALAWLEGAGAGPLFVWVHFYDPHEPYEPPEPFRSRFPEDPYQGEIAAMDAALGRLLDGFSARAGAGARVLVAGDHGEGLGDHGELRHGNLLYQGVMRVPLVIAGEGLAAGAAGRVVAHPVSARRVFDTVLAWAGEERPHALPGAPPEPVLGEAMRPHLQYGWRPQVMAVAGTVKAIRAGSLEVYDVAADPAESHDLAGGAELPAALRRALREYPLPAADDPAGTPAVPREEVERLASLGYVGRDGRAPERADAPSPRDMTHLFADLDLGSGLFARGDYARAIPVFERVLSADPENLAVRLRLAAAHSALGRDRPAMEHFRRARALAPRSADVDHYLGLHHLSAGRWEEAEPLLERALAASPGRLAALEALARIRARQGRTREAAGLLERAAALDPGDAAKLVRLGELAMAAGDTAAAIAAFERARAIEGERFAHHLELGVLYLAGRRLAEAARSLDRVPAGHPGHPMALFKRAQVSVLLGEPDRAERVRRAVERADPTTRPLIENEALFRDLR